MCYTSTFWKCVWFENMGSITKVMSKKVKNVTWRFCPFFSFGMVERSVGLTAADFYPFPFKNSFLQRVCLLRIVRQRVKVFSRLLPCSGVTGKWHLSGNSYAGPAKWRENNGAKMTSRSRQKFPRANERGKTSQNHTPPLQLLDRCRFDPKRRFWAAFQFPGTRNKWMYYSLEDLS